LAHILANGGFRSATLRSTHPTRQQNITFNCTRYIPQLLSFQQRHIDKINDIINHHAKPHDFLAVKTELASQLFSKPNGGYWDHIQEMKDSVGGLKRAIRALKGSLNDPKHSQETRCSVISQIEIAENILTKMKNTLAGQELEV